MKVIFIKDLKGQGKKGEIKEVKDGYGMNYLIKNGYAVMYTKTSLERLNTENKIKKEQEEENIKNALALKEKLENIILKIKVKAGTQDKVFGSVSTKQIVNELQKNNFNIDKKKIKLNNELCSLGTHTVIVELHKTVTAQLKVLLEKE